jgi:hypothetical protein
VDYAADMIFLFQGRTSLTVGEWFQKRGGGSIGRWYRSILWYQSARQSRCARFPGLTSLRGGIRGKHPTYVRVADVADALILNRGEEMDTRVAAGAGHTGADTGRETSIKVWIGVRP